MKLSRLALIHLHDGQAAPYSDLMTATAPPMTPCDVDLMLQRLAELQGAEKGDMHQRWKNLDRGTLKPLLGGRQAPRESAGASLLSRDEYHSLPDEQDMAGPTEVGLDIVDKVSRHRQLPYWWLWAGSLLPCHQYIQCLKQSDCCSGSLDNHALVRH